MFYQKMSTLIKPFHAIRKLSELQRTTPTIKFSEVNGKTFVITGAVRQFQNRDEVKAAIETHGGKVTASVSKNTDYLINNDINSTSSKNIKAKQLGIPIITEEQLIAML